MSLACQLSLVIIGHAITDEGQQPGKWRKEETQVSTTNSALDLLLGSDVSPVTTLSLSAVLGLRGESGIALTADHLLALELSGKSSERGLNLEGTHTTTSKSEDEMEGGLLLDVVVRRVLPSSSCLPAKMSLC